MSMNATYRNALATQGATLITHIGLVNGSGVELAGGGPAYARQPVTFTAAVNGTIRPTVDLTFDIPAGATVAGWRGYSAGSGGTEFGGESLTAETYGGQGQYTLLAARTAIRHE